MTAEEAIAEIEKILADAVPSPGVPGGDNAVRATGGLLGAIDRVIRKYRVLGERAA